MKNELMGLLDTYIDHDENCTMLGKSPVCHCDHTRYVAEAHAAIEAWANARFERVLRSGSISLATHEHLRHIWYTPEPKGEQKE